MELATSRKGGVICIYDGYKYRLDRLSSRTALWRCISPKCRARAKTSFPYEHGSHVSVHGCHAHSSMGFADAQENFSAYDPSTFGSVFSHSTLPDLTKHHTFDERRSVADPEDYMSMSLLNFTPSELPVEQRCSTPESVMSITEYEHCPAERPMTRLDCEFDEVRRKQFPTADEKIDAYMKILSKFTDNSMTYENPSALDVQRPSQDQSVSAESIIGSLPKYKKDKARLLLRNLTSHSSAIAWTKNKSLVLNGIEVPSSNMVNLLNYAFARNTLNEPECYPTFWKALRDVGVPVSLINPPGTLKSTSAHTKPFKWVRY